MNKILVTGTAGFIGYHLANRLLEEGYEVTGLDSINSYYDTRLKYDRLSQAGINPNEIAKNRASSSHKYPDYRFFQMELEDRDAIFQLFKEERFDGVVHLAAQAGVRYSLSHPEAYIQSNINGFLNILEACRKYPVKNLIYASSSSVYGLNASYPFSV